MKNFRKLYLAPLWHCMRIQYIIPIETNEKNGVTTARNTFTEELIEQNYKTMFLILIDLFIFKSCIGEILQWNKK